MDGNFIFIFQDNEREKPCVPYLSPKLSDRMNEFKNPFFHQSNYARVSGHSHVSA
jgi:hypothetical protein